MSTLHHSPSTPLPVIAHVSRVVTRVVDRLAGDRVEVPLLVAAACVESLKNFQIPSQIMFGQGAWIEILADHSIVWAGCWGKHSHFWVATTFGEVVDLNVSVAHRKRSHASPQLESRYSPPLLWSAEVPNFYRYMPEGVAELDTLEPSDQRLYERVLEEIRQQYATFSASAAGSGEMSALDFPNEPILCPGRQLLDDSKNTFKAFDRAIAVQGIPHAPF